MELIAIQATVLVASRDLPFEPAEQDVKHWLQDALGDAHTVVEVGDVNLLKIGAFSVDGAPTIYADLETHIANGVAEVVIDDLASRMSDRMTEAKPEQFTGEFSERPLASSLNLGVAERTMLQQAQEQPFVKDFFEPVDGSFGRTSAQGDGASDFYGDDDPF